MLDVVGMFWVRWEMEIFHIWYTERQKKKGWVLSKANQIQRDWWTYGQMALLWI